jgi:hypothetical protein
MMEQIRHLQSRAPFETFALELANGRVIQIHERHLVATTRLSGVCRRSRPRSDVFCRNVRGWIITDVLDNLYALGLVRFHIQRTAGRPVTRWALSSVALSRRAQAAAAVNSEAINV